MALQNRDGMQAWRKAGEFERGENVLTLSGDSDIVLLIG
jgi:hypothetical protein